MIRFGSVWLACCLCMANGALAQKGGAVRVPSPVLIPPSNPNPSLPSRTTSSANPTNSSNPTNDLYVSGKVVVQDGGELPANVVVEKICGNKKTALGYADHRGNFSLKLTGTSLAAMLDVSADSSSSEGRPSSSARDQGSANLLGCEIQAATPGFRSAAIQIGTRRVLDNPDIGNLVIRRIDNGSGTLVSATLLRAPKNALKAYERGMADLRKFKTNAAEKEFQKAVNLHPAFANAWYELGHLRMSSNEEEAAVDLEKAISADSRYIPPYADLAILAYRKKNWKETIDITNRGLRLDSAGSPQLYFFNAAAEFNLRNMNEAEKKVREAIRLDFEHALSKAPQLLCYVLALRGDLAGAAEQMRIYLANNPDPTDVDRSRGELARMEAQLKTRAAGPQ